MYWGLICDPICGHRYLQVFCLPLGLILWSLCSVLPCLLIFFILRSIFSDMELLLHLSFASHLHGIYFSILSHSVYMGLYVWSRFLVDIIYMGLVFFNPFSQSVFWLQHLIHFTYKVIIDIYVPIAIFLIVQSLIFWIFFLLYFLTIYVPLTFVVKLVWWYWILLSFACLKSFLFLNQFWMRSSPGTVILVVDFSLSVL